MLMGEFVTAVKYKLPIKVIIIKNNTLGQIKWEQMVFLGNPEYVCDLYPVDFVGIARGLRRDRLHASPTPRIVGGMLQQALDTPGPVIIEAVVDQFEAPMPPEVKPEQALHFAEALTRGEPDAGKIFKNAMKEKIREMV